MSIFSDDEPSTPFFIPFVTALCFGIPACVIWYLVAMHAGIVATIITILLGCLCGLGARIGARGWHPAPAAIIADPNLDRRDDICDHCRDYLFIQ